MLIYISTLQHCLPSFDVKLSDLPEVQPDWKRFSEVISELNDKTPMVWNPITKKVSKWIDMRQLTAAYGGTGRDKAIFDHNAKSSHI